MAIESSKQVVSMESRLPRRRAVFAWDMHYKYNFSCDYCFYTIAGWSELAKKNVYKSPEEWEAVWRRLYDKYGRCQLRVTAGEPFTYPRFVEVVAAVSRLQDLQITTNASVGPAIERLTGEADPKAVEFDCTFHPLSADLEAFLPNVLALRRAGFVANVCFLAYPLQMDRMAEFKRRFAEGGIRMNMAIYWGEYEGKRYPFAYTDAVVQSDGRVYRCGQLCEEHLSIGGIFDGDFELNREALPCPSEFCRCKEYQSVWEEEEAKLLDDKGKVSTAN